MEIPPSTSLITALSDYTESRRAEVAEQKKTSAKSRQSQDAPTSNALVQVSSEQELQAARDAASQVEDQSVFHREAPTAGGEERHQPLGQIIDISV